MMAGLVLSQTVISASIWSGPTASASAASSCSATVRLSSDQKSGIFQLERSGLRDPARINRLLLVVAIAVLFSNLQGFAVSCSSERRLVDSHWKWGFSFARIGLHSLQQSVIRPQALYPQPQRQTTTTALVLLDQTAKATSPHSTSCGSMTVSAEMCPSISALSRPYARLCRNDLLMGRRLGGAGETA